MSGTPANPASGPAQTPPSKSPNAPRPRQLTRLGVASIVFALGSMPANALCLFHAVMSYQSFVEDVPGPIWIPIWINEVKTLTVAAGALAGTAIGTCFLACGIAVLRNARTGGRLLKRCALIQLVLAFLAAPVYASWHYDLVILLMGNMAMAPSLAAQMSAALALTFSVAAIQIPLGLTYPIVVLLVLRTKRVRDFYAVAAPAAPVSPS